MSFFSLIFNCLTPCGITATFLLSKPCFSKTSLTLLLGAMILSAFFIISFYSNLFFTIIGAKKGGVT
jgi:hypothetical protein